MGRRRQEPDDLEPLAIEVFDGTDLEDSEVHLGGRRRPAAGAAGPEEPPAPGRVPTGWVVAGVLAVVGAVVAVGALSAGRDATPRATPTTSRPATTTTTTTEPSSTVPAPTVPAVTVAPTLSPIVPSTYPELVGGREGSADPDVDGLASGALFALSGSASQVFLWDTAGGPTALVAYDLRTGTLEPVELDGAAGPIKAVVPTDSGLAVDAGQLVFVGADGPVPMGWGDAGVTDFLQSGPRVARGPDGMVWIRTLKPASLALFDPSSGRNLGRYELPLGVELIGSTADGRPVVRGPDLGSYVISEGGSSQLLADGITTPVEDGWYTVLHCDPPSQCLVSIPGAGTTYAAPTSAELERTTFRFAPGGTHLAVALDDAVRIVDTFSGEGVVVGIGHVSTGEPVSRPAANYLSLARDLAWTPDGLLLGMLTEQGVVFVDLTGRPVARLLLDPEAPLRYVPLALG